MIAVPQPRNLLAIPRIYSAAQGRVNGESRISVDYEPGFSGMSMKVLLIGSGGREHALARALRKSESVAELYAAPGNPGIAQVADVVPISPDSVVELADFAAQLAIDLTVVGPELPLSLGIVDEFQKRGLSIFG